jgi:iron-sulfur cluster assembly protein
MPSANGPITITENALRHIRVLLNKKNDKPYGIRISLKTKGCTGLSYAINYALEKQPFDEEITIEDIHILIDPKAILYIMGTEMDYKESAIESGFTFENPNEKGRCGCGKSFHV